MKKFSILALALVLCTAMFTGCRNRSDVNNTTTPTGGMTTAPTVATTRPTTQPTTQATTEAATESTAPATQHIPEGTDNGPMDGNTATDATGSAEGRMRRAIPGHR